MAQPEIQDTKYGIPRMIYGSDGTNWIAVLVDALGHLQVDVVSAALGSGGATEATLLLIKGYVDALETLLAGGLPAALDSGALKVKEQSPLSGGATETTLLLIKGYVDALETLLAGGLPAALDSGGLKVKEQSPLTGFATATNQTTMITALQLIDDLRAALGSVNTDDLQVDVKTSALPTDAATQTTLALVKTAVEKIDDLQGALGSVNTDDLQMDVKTYPGSNALGNFPFGYYDRYAEALQNLDAVTGSNFLYGTEVPAGEVWVLTAANILNYTTAAGTVGIGVYDGATFNTIADARFFTPTRSINWGGQAFAKAGDKFFGYFGSCAVGDDLYVRFIGYKMKVA